MRGVFAWENKAPGKNLDAALKQLLTYSLALANPPILVVSDRLTIRVHTQFTGHPSESFTVTLAELEQPEQRQRLRRIWTAPDSFKPKQTSRDITEAAAQSFAQLADSLRQRDPQPEAANRVSHFLTQCVFCLFAEDVGLLPGRMFERLLANQHATPQRLTQGLTQLFETMRSGGLYGVDDIPWFNGGLFQTVDVPPLTAPELARVTVWIGELQWRIDHGYAFKTNPVLEALDHIECRDALLRFAAGDAGSGSGSGAAKVARRCGCGAGAGGSQVFDLDIAPNPHPTHTAARPWRACGFAGCD